MPATISGRDIFINGETLVNVKGRSDSAIASLSELGLAADQVRITPVFNHRDVNADAWGSAPFECQWMLAEVQVSMTLIHFDRGVLNTCLALSMGGDVSAVGNMARAGKRMGNNLNRFAVGVGPGNLGVVGNNFMGLQMTSPQGGIPWQFFFAYLMNPPAEFPLGTEKSLIPLRWRVIPYVGDPYQAGFGATNYPLWSHTVLDT